MLKYIAKRFGYSILTLWVLITVTFFLMHLLPGDPFVGDKPLSDSVKAAIYARYGLDQPVYIQYLRYMQNVLHGDLGSSLIYSGQSVTNMISAAFPYSADLALRSLTFAIPTGMLIGIMAALHRGGPWDTTALVITALGVSIPSFVLASILQYYLGVVFSSWTLANWGFRAFPISGWGTPQQAILPCFILGFSNLAEIIRMTRSSLLEVSGQDYIRTAKAKGLSERKIVWRHILRNSLCPIITILGPLIASCLTGSFIIESIFNIPGVGKFMIMGVETSDYMVTAGSTIFYGVLIVGANFIVDMLYMVIDPNIRLYDDKEA